MNVLLGLRYRSTQPTGYGAYLILYRAIGGGAEIVRVVHAVRNLEDLV